MFSIFSRSLDVATRREHWDVPDTWRVSDPWRAEPPAALPPVRERRHRLRRMLQQARFTLGS